MAKDGVLHLDLFDLAGDRIRQPVELELNHRRLQDRQRIRAADASETLVVSGLHRTPEGIYTLRVRAASYRPLQRFVRIAPSGPTHLRLVLGSSLRDPRRPLPPEQVLDLDLRFEPGEIPPGLATPCGTAGPGGGLSSETLDQLRQQEPVLMDWLRSGSDHPRRFADDPLDAFEAAGLDLSPQSLDELRRVVPQRRVEDGFPPGFRFQDVRVGVVEPAQAQGPDPVVEPVEAASALENDPPRRFAYRFEVAETAINQQLASLHEVGVFPEEAFLAFADGAFQGVFRLHLGSPQLRLLADDRVDLILPFSDSSLALLEPEELRADKLGGNLRLTCKLQVDCVDGRCSVVIDFANGIEDAVLWRNPGWDAQVLSLGGAASLVPGWLITAMTDFLSTQIRELPLSGAVPITPRDAATPTAVTEMAVRGLADDGEGALLYLFTAGQEQAGDPQAIQTSRLPAGSSAALLVSTPFFLEHLLCPQIAEALDIPADERDEAFEAPCRLVKSQPLPDKFKLEDLEATIVDGRVRVRGKSKRSGTGWTAEGSFEMTLEPALDDDGMLTWNASEIETDSKLSVEWWAWVLATITGGLAGVAAGGVALAIADKLFEGEFGDRVNGFFDGELDGLGGFGDGSDGSGGLLGAAGAGLVPDSVRLDGQYLTLAGSMTPVELPGRPPEAPTDELVLAPGQSLDFERRRIAQPSTSSGFGTYWRSEIPVDIAWTLVGGSLAVEARNGAEILDFHRANLEDAPPPRPIGTTFRVLDTPKTIPASVIPLGLHVTDPGAWENVAPSVLDPEPLTFDLRTGQNNFVRAEVWRDPWNLLYLRYELEAAVPDFDITLGWDSFDPQPLGDGVDRWTDARFEIRPRPTFDGGGPGRLTLRTFAQERPFERIALARHVRLRAAPRRLAYPLTYQWKVAGQALEPGEGEVTLDGAALEPQVSSPVTLRYHLRQDQLELWSAPGQDLNVLVTSEVHDHHGERRCTSRRIELAGVVKVGGRPTTDSSPLAQGALADLLREQHYEVPGRRLWSPRGLAP